MPMLLILKLLLLMPSHESFAEEPKKILTIRIPCWRHMNDAMHPQILYHFATLNQLSSHLLDMAMCSLH